MSWRTLSRRTSTESGCWWCWTTPSIYCPLSRMSCQPLPCYAPHSTCSSRVGNGSRSRSRMVWPVPPLLHRDAQQMFVERARSLGVELRQDENVSELCRRLDELPLALELAAARTVVSHPQLLAAHTASSSPEAGRWTQIRANGRFARRSTGRMNCSQSTNSACSARSACLRADAHTRQPRRSRMPTRTAILLEEPSQAGHRTRPAVLDARNDPRLRDRETRVARRRDGGTPTSCGVVSRSCPSRARGSGPRRAASRRARARAVPRRIRQRARRARLVVGHRERTIRKLSWAHRVGATGFLGEGLFRDATSWLREALPKLPAAPAETRLQALKVAGLVAFFVLANSGQADALWVEARIVAEALQRDDETAWIDYRRSSVAWELGDVEGAIAAGAPARLPSRQRRPFRRSERAPQPRGITPRYSVDSRKPNGAC